MAGIDAPSSVYPLRLDLGDYTICVGSEYHEWRNIVPILTEDGSIIIVKHGQIVGHYREYDSIGIM